MLYIKAEEALELGRAMVPRWVEHRGCIVRQERFDVANFDEWWTSTGGGRRDIEIGLNHLHLWDLLFNADETNYAELWDLGELMVVGWQASLRRSFPDLEFEVTLIDDYGPTITAVTVEPT